MDRLYRIRRTVNVEFTPGNCELCNQKNVKVKPLTCGNHSYCRMCAEFAPRLTRGDFSCQSCCSSSRRASAAENKQRVEKFLAEQTGMNSKKFKDATDSISTLSDTDDDLSGNNTEWDYLLQSDLQTLNKSHRPPVTGSTRLKTSDARSSPERTKPKAKLKPLNITRKIPKPQPLCQLIPRKPSLISLPRPPDTTKHCTSPQFSSNRKPISNTVTELLNSPFSPRPPCGPRRERRVGSSPASTGSSSSTSSSSQSYGSWHEPLAPRPVFGTRKSASADSFIVDPLELERCTSPCKASRTTVPPWQPDKFRASEDEDESETEVMKQEVGVIEGPGYHSSCSDLSKNDQAADSDDFWDF